MIRDEKILAKEGRKLHTQVDKLTIQIGRLLLIDTGAGWLKVQLTDDSPSHSSAELLEPEYSRQLLTWLQKRILRIKK